MSYSHDNPRKIPEGIRARTGITSGLAPMVLVFATYFGATLHHPWDWAMLPFIIGSFILVTGRCHVWMLTGSPTLHDGELRWRSGKRPEYLNAVPRDRI